MHAHGNVNLLRALDLPAVATLVRNGRRIRVLVEGVGGGHVTLARAPGVTRRFPLSAFRRLWFGQMWLLWRPPEGTPLIRQGMSGPAVAWLRRSLAVPAATAGGPYGDDLAAAVRRFQAHHGLATDGIAGPKTLIALERSRGKAAGPRLKDD